MRTVVTVDVTPTHDVDTTVPVLRALTVTRPLSRFFSGPEPRWHAILEAKSTSRPHGGAGQGDTLLTRRMGYHHRGGQRYQHSTGVSRGRLGDRFDARAGGNGGGHRGGGSDRLDGVRQSPRTDKRTVAQKKRIKLKRVPEENDKRKRKKAKKLSGLSMNSTTAGGGGSDGRNQHHRAHRAKSPVPSSRQGAGKGKTPTKNDRRVAAALNKLMGHVHRR